MFHLSEERQILLTNKIMATLDEWGLSAADQVVVLNLPEDTRTRKLRAYHESTPLPNNTNVEFRAVRLLGIIDALRTTYPKNESMGARWMKKPHRRFQKRCPLQVLVEDGDTGINTVLAELDCAYAWELSGSQAK